MPLLSWVDERSTVGHTKDIFERLRQADILPPRLYRILGHAPEMLKAWTDIAWPLRSRSRTDRGLREMMIVRIAQLTENAYELDYHLIMARTAGVHERKISAIASWRDAPLFSKTERLCLQLAEEVARGPGAAAATIEALKTDFSEADIVELVLTASFYVCVGRFVASLQIGREDQTALEQFSKVQRPGA